MRLPQHIRVGNAFFPCLLALAIVSGASCVSTASRGREDISADLHERTGAPLRPDSVTDPLPPEGVDLQDGLSQREAVAIALWNNPQFEADLADLGFARAELAQAGALQNPFLALFFPLGFITVLGIAARNGIMLVSHYRHLETEEDEPFGERLALRGAEERLAPILMTALTAMLALLPIVVRGNVPGQEIEHPMAVVIVGGLLTSTFLNLFLLPALYARFGEPARPEANTL